MNKSVTLSKIACCNGYITQAICINLLPLLYAVFYRQYGISYSLLSLLIAVNFGFEMILDFGTAKLAKYMNVRLFTVLAHVSTVLGLWGLAFLPMVMPVYPAVILCNLLLGMGGGLTEVMISPIMEALPTDGKASNMSFLHSFYCWGATGVIFLCGLFFAFFETSDWQILPLVWSVFPLVGIFLFLVCPIYDFPPEEETNRLPETRKKQRKTVAILFVMMLCAGAGEQVIAQWASTFCEMQLLLPKELGDILGPGLFALMMGVTRLFSARLVKKVMLEQILLAGNSLCAIGFLISCLPFTATGIVGIVLVGIGVATLWPGILSYSAKALPSAGVPLFATLALAGDIGCFIGPTVTGALADALGGDLRFSFAVALLYPVVFFCLGTFLFTRKKGTLQN